MHQPVIVWWWILTLTLTQLDGDSLLILCIVFCDNGRLVSGKFWLQADRSGHWSVCHLQMKNVYAAGWWNCAVGTLLLPHWPKTILGLLTFLCDKCRSKHGATEPAGCSNMWQQTMRLLTYCQNGSYTSFVGQEPAQNGRTGCKSLEEKKTVTILGTSVCVCVVAYPGAMLSKAGKCYWTTLSWGTLHCVCRQMYFFTGWENQYSLRIT